MRKNVTAFIVMSLLAAVSLAAENDVLKNWFNDPFFQISRGVPECPVPRGPLLTEADMKSESHSRVERGTSCWLAGKCERPNAYMYDARIAAAIQERIGSHPLFDNSSLWITVKRKFVWVEGCFPHPEQKTALENLMLSVPDVERVIVNIMPGIDGKPPYQLP